MFDGLSRGVASSHHQEAGIHVLLKRYGIGKAKNRRGIDQHPIKAGRNLLNDGAQCRGLQKFRGIPSWLSGRQKVPPKRLHAPYML